MNARCGKTERHTPHWWETTSELEGFNPKYWCDGKPPNPNLVED